MAFPGSPTNGQTAVINGVTYTYNSTKDTWSVLNTNTAQSSLTFSGNLSAANLTNTRYVSRITSSTSVTSPLSWNSDSTDMYTISAQAEALTINADAGTPVNGQKMMFRIKDNGVARALTLTTGTTNSFRAIGVALPTTTTVNKTLYIGCVYNGPDSRWDVIASVTEL